jgi:hypothetical protein
LLRIALAHDVPKSKLILSIPTYGLSFELDNPKRIQLNGSVIAQGAPGRITHTLGMLASYEVKKKRIRIWLTFPTHLSRSAIELNRTVGNDR